MFNRMPLTKALQAHRLAREITSATYLVGLKLLRMSDRRGRAWPSRATLAALVGHAESTVELATARLRELGLLSWTTRRLRWNRMDSNLYQLGGSQPAVRKEESRLGFSSPKIGDGSAATAPPPLTPALQAALARLGAAMGVPMEAVCPWLTPAVGLE